jgi:lysophospholipase L1-like esterase
MACGCTPYVSLIAEQMTHSTGIRVTAVNDAVSGSNSTGLLASLRAASTTASDAARADVVIVTIGANDFTVPSAGAASCVTATSCYQTGLMTLDANITATIAQLRALRQARQLPPATIVVTGYWNVWQDGAVAAQMGSDFVRLSRAITSATNDVLSQAARAQGVWYVDLVRPFLGADEDDDDTSLLAPDGDHPDAEGHQLIATAILQAVPSLLQRPQ